MRAHRVGDDDMRPRAPPLPGGEQVIEIVEERIEARHMTHQRIAGEPPRAALAAPVEPADVPPGRSPVVQRLQVLFDEVSAPAQEEQAAAPAAAVRRPVEAADRPAVAGRPALKDEAGRVAAAIGKRRDRQAAIPAGRRRRTLPPTRPKPAIIIAQVAGSGTAATLRPSTTKPAVRLAVAATLPRSDTR